MARPDVMQGMAAAQKELAKLDGVPVLRVMNMGAEGTIPPQPPSDSEAAAQKQQQPPPSGAEASVGPAPMMVIDSTTHDFGEVKAGTPLRYAFKVKNTGNSDLLINNVSPG